MTLSQLFQTFGGRRKRILALALTLLALGLALPVAASNHVNTTTGLTLAGAPLALRGYDPVAYFTEGRAVLGKPGITAAFDGAVYQFSSEANRSRFERNPSRYAPQYGGFCAFGVSVGAKFDGDPTVFKVVGDKLYLNVNTDIQKKWEADIEGNLQKSDKNWKRIRDAAPSELK